MTENPSNDELLAKTLARLKKLEELVEHMQTRFEEIETTKPSVAVRPSQLNRAEISEIDFMNLPDSLRRTMMTIIKLQDASSEEVASETNRTRGLENIYLNQLERMGYIEKVKRGKKVYFRTLRAVNIK